MFWNDTHAKPHLDAEGLLGDGLTAVFFVVCVCITCLLGDVDVISVIYSWVDYWYETSHGCWLVLLLYVPSQQLWSLRDGQFT